MTAWSDFKIVQELLVSGFFGSEALLSAAIFFGIFIMFSSRLDIRQATVLTLPLLGGFAIGGWLGANVWALNLLLMVVGLIYATVVMKMTQNAV